MVDPDRQPLLTEARIAGSGAEEEYLVPRRRDAIAHDIGKDFSQPRTAGEHVPVGGKLRGVGQLHARECVSLCAARRGFELTICAALLNEAFQHTLAVAARGKIPGVLFVDHPFDALKIHLRPALGSLSRGQLLEGQSDFAQQRDRRFLVCVVRSGQEECRNRVRRLPLYLGLEGPLE